MRSVVAPLLLAATALGAVASGRTSRQEIENVATFARLYGVVRFFYPSDIAASLDWDRFAVYGVKQVRAALDGDGLKTTLDALFSPLGPGIEIGASLPPRLDVGHPDSSLIAWRYLGDGAEQAQDGVVLAREVEITHVGLEEPAARMLLAGNAHKRGIPIQAVH